MHVFALHKCIYVRSFCFCFGFCHFIYLRSFVAFNIFTVGELFLLLLLLYCVQLHIVFDSARVKDFSSLSYRINIDGNLRSTIRSKTFVGTNRHHPELHFYRKIISALIRCSFQPNMELRIAVSVCFFFFRTDFRVFILKLQSVSVIVLDYRIWTYFVEFPVNTEYLDISFVFLHKSDCNRSKHFAMMRQILWFNAYMNST